MATEFKKKDIVVIALPPDAKPHYGWQRETSSGSFGIVDGTSANGKVVNFFTSLKNATSFLSTELKVVKHPWVASFSSLGAGVTSAVIDAEDRETAMSLAQDMIGGAPDVTGRTLSKLPWSVPVAKGAVSLNPVFIGVEDAQPKLVNMASTIYRKI